MRGNEASIRLTTDGGELEKSNDSLAGTCVDMWSEKKKGLPAGAFGGGGRNQKQPEKSHQHLIKGRVDNIPEPKRRTNKMQVLHEEKGEKKDGGGFKEGGQKLFTKAETPLGRKKTRKKTVTTCIKRAFGSILVTQGEQGYCDEATEKIHRTQRSGTGGGKVRVWGKEPGEEAGGSLPNQKGEGSRRRMRGIAKKKLNSSG